MISLKENPSELNRIDEKTKRKQIYRISSFLINELKI